MAVTRWKAYALRCACGGRRAQQHTFARGLEERGGRSGLCGVNARANASAFYIAGPGRRAHSR